MEHDRPIMTLDEVADYIRMRPITLYKYAAKGMLPGFKVGSQWRFRREMIDAWIEKASAEVRRKANLRGAREKT